MSYRPLFYLGHEKLQCKFSFFLLYLDIKEQFEYTQIINIVSSYFSMSNTKFERNQSNIDRVIAP